MKGRQGARTEGRTDGEKGEKVMKWEGGSQEKKRRKRGREEEEGEEEEGERRAIPHSVLSIFIRASPMCLHRKLCSSCLEAVPCSPPGPEERFNKP